MLNITSRIDKLPTTPMLKKILFWTGIGWMFDAMDQGMVAGVMAAIGKDWELTTGQLGLLGSSGMLGMALGAALSGMAADRWGRRKVIMWTLIIYGIASGLSGFATSYPMLLALRFLTGFGLGGELPAASTLVSEYSPTKDRGRNVIILESFWAWGWIAAALVAYLMIPVYGWRTAFWVGALPALFAAYFRKVVPESPRYLELTGRIKEADELVGIMEKQAGISYESGITANENSNQQGNGRITFADLWSKKYIRSTVVLWVIWFGINFGYYGFVLWTPSLLVDKGFDLVRSFEFTLIMCLAQLPGYFSAAYLVEKVGRKMVLAVYFAGTALAAWLFGHAGSSLEVIIYGSLLYFFSLGAWGCVYAYTPEVYPTVARASGTGWASAFGRLGAFLAPFVVPVVYKSFGTQAGFGYVFLMLTAVFATVALVVAVFGKETMGKSLEEISIHM
ncbi:putative metabolite transport protein YceI (plasmid) [Peptoclostridium acidaminophilum DSM 3953]|uniref:Putative metabolite transport protein YceI n=1 Tax=Peptoclostridium acidaminophilum DSM 3953 TaxID=1286171 RepID=W8TAL7_PEPAC|nr:MFS transporter [Peptoclostridium acidaminophilum]AHM57935.1 putative metabolite transport protein YceI [Peptoclostridium acidaminophilum DSM 3953]